MQDLYHQQYSGFDPLSPCFRRHSSTRIPDPLLSKTFLSYQDPARLAAPESQQAERERGNGGPPESLDVRGRFGFIIVSLREGVPSPLEPPSRKDPISLDC